jgi:hypothetical protein
MTPEEIVAAFRENIGKRLRVTFADGAVMSVTVGPDDGDGSQTFWKRFEDVRSIEPEMSP